MGNETKTAEAEHVQRLIAAIREIADMEGVGIAHYSDLFHMAAQSLALLFLARRQRNVELETFLGNLLTSDIFVAHVRTEAAVPE